MGGSLANQVRVVKGNEKICYNKAPKMKLHFISAICSVLIVGLGQIIKGQNKKGILLLLVFYFVLPSLVYISLIINGYLFLYVFSFAIISAIILWIYNIGDALLKT